MMIVQIKNIRSYIYSMLFLLAAFCSSKGFAQAESAREEDYFRILRVPTPEGVFLEVGGLCTLPNGDLAVTTRRGDVFIVENPTSQRPYFGTFASGLHEVLGLAYKDGALYCTQRGELTKLVDTDYGWQGRCSRNSVAWPLSGNYHEYTFGQAGTRWSFLCYLQYWFSGRDWWHPTSPVPWRGWTLNM